jgi:hypothetical protein
MGTGTGRMEAGLPARSIIEQSIAYRTMHRYYCRYRGLVKNLKAPDDV